MKSFAIAAGAAAVLACSAAGTFAQDSTTTTTTVHHDEQTSPGPGVNVGVPGIVGVHVGGPSVETGCTTKRSTTTDNDTGASTTVKRSDC